MDLDEFMDKQLLLYTRRLRWDLEAEEPVLKQPGIVRVRARLNGVEATRTVPRTPRRIFDRSIQDLEIVGCHHETILRLLQIMAAPTEVSALPTRRAIERTAKQMYSVAEQMQKLEETWFLLADDYARLKRGMKATANVEQARLNLWNKLNKLKAHLKDDELQLIFRHLMPLRDVMRANLERVVSLNKRARQYEQWLSRHLNPRVELLTRPRRLLLGLYVYHVTAEYHAPEVVGILNSLANQNEIRPGSNAPYSADLYLREIKEFVQSYPKTWQNLRVCFDRLNFDPLAKERHLIASERKQREAQQSKALGLRKTKHGRR